MCVDWEKIEGLASPPCWLWWFSFKQILKAFWEEKWAKGWEIKLTSRGVFTRGKYRRERSHSGAFVSLVQPGSAAHMYRGRWLNMRYWNETKLKARRIIGFGSAWTWVCAQQCGCVCTAGACAQGHLSREQGLALPGTATGPLRNRWTPPSPCPSLFRNKGVKKERKRSLLTKHHFSYGKTLLFFPFPTPG